VFERFDDEARSAIDRAFEEARSFGHGQVGTEHLLLGLLGFRDSNAASTLIGCGATLEGCRAKVAEAAAAKRVSSGRTERTLTDRAARALERAGRLSLRQLRDEVGTDHILLSVLDVEGTAGQVLRGLAVDPARVRSALQPPAAPEPRAEAVPSVTGASREGSPACPRCGASFEATLAHKSVTSSDDAGDRIRWLVAYCSSCGGGIGAYPVAEP
jgi:ATP-dependent Clp protease ATP-binding subunit ClpA